MQSTSIKELLSTNPTSQEVVVNGWVKSFRSNRFIALNDGSTINNIQCVVDFEQLDESLLKQINTGAALKITGALVESQGRGQSVEIQATDIFVHGGADPETYPIQPKKHSMEFLREQAHLRVRTNTFSAVMRVRSALAFAVHKYFTENGFYNMHTPIITGSDAEVIRRTLVNSGIRVKPVTDIKDTGDGDSQYKQSNCFSISNASYEKLAKMQGELEKDAVNAGYSAHTRA